MYNFYYRKKSIEYILCSYLDIEFKVITNIGSDFGDDANIRLDKYGMLALFCFS